MPEDTVPSNAAVTRTPDDVRLFGQDRNCLSWWFPKLLRAGLPSGNKV